MKKLWVLCLFAVLSFPACGDDSNSQKPDDALAEYLRQGGDPATFPGGLPANMPGLIPDGMAPGSIKLTNEMMEEYVGLLEKLKDAGEDGPTAAWLATHNWDLQRYAAISSLIARSHVATATDGKAERLKKMIAEHTAQLAKAEGSQKQMLEMWIENEKKGLEAIEKMPAATDVDRKNFELIEHWMPKIEAATR